MLEDKLQELVLSFHHMVLRIELNELIRHDGTCLYLLTGSFIYILKYDDMMGIELGRCSSVTSHTHTPSHRCVYEIYTALYI